MAHMSRRSSTSTPALGSSRNSTRGSWASALAIITRRFIPPDNWRVIASRLSHSDSRRSVSSTRARSRGSPNMPRENATVSRTRLKGSSTISCGTSPTSRRAARKSVTTSWPPTRTCPPVGRVMPQTVEISVVLPAPFGPRSARISPSRTDSDTASSAA